MKYCKAQKWRSDDPADRDIIGALPKQMRKSNHMKSMDYREVGSFITDMKNSSAGTTTKLALEFLILNCLFDFTNDSSRIDFNVRLFFSVFLDATGAKSSSQL